MSKSYHGLPRLRSSELRELQKKQDQRIKIFQLVTQMRFVLGMGPYEEEFEDDASSPQTAQPDQLIVGTSPIASEERFLDGGTVAHAPSKIWQLARDILQQANKPLTINEIMRSLQGFGSRLAGRPGKETVRSILHKKSEVFERTTDGKYRLKV